MNRREYLATFSASVTGLTILSGTSKAASDAAGSLHLEELPDDRQTLGDEAKVKVEVKNEGDSSNRMYVGYSVTDPDGDYLDNGKTTDKATEYLSSGDTQIMTLEWTVTEDASPGEYGFIVKLWDNRENNNGPDESMQDELDTIDRTDETVFKVVK
ncbi:hypothetical protein G3I44_04210 [Halogeometricum borinquense]|uniref:CARDB domain-containing protein n=1 Tax=Halogeometricum borinquense TaxID=60847 RepID=A0A6C0UDU3_9EURY|nr:hypothetical protein [Halogeometricum borinquense]QIB73556.1 hypothetical protein G3I44_04210 [Halogeometricum borinquense]